MIVRALIFLALLAAASPAEVTYDRLLRADREPQNWLSYSGNYAGHRYSPLSQIDRTNIKYLQLKWSYHPLYTKNSNSQNKMENSPLVVDGIMYTGTALEVVALDAVTGRQYWKFARPLDPKEVLQRLRSQQRDGHRRGQALLGHGRLSPDRDRREDGPRDLGQGPGRLQEGLPVQRAPARRARHGHPRTCDQ